MAESNGHMSAVRDDVQSRAGPDPLNGRQALINLAGLRPALELQRHAGASSNRTELQRRFGLTCLEKKANTCGMLPMMIVP
jgi:hypothetical protein